MAYIIYRSDGTVLLTMADGDVDSITTSLDLIGKNVNKYGQYVNNNFVKLLTNFASPNQPLQAQVGQLWYDTINSKLTVYDGVEFNPTYGATISGTQPVTTSTGDLWYNSTNGEFKIWQGYPLNQWFLVDPRVDLQNGKMGVMVPPVNILENTFNQKQNVSVLYSYGAPTALVTTASFTMSASSSTVYFGQTTATNVVNGITILDDLDVKGNLYVRGNTVYDKNLTTAFDITTYGDTKTGTTGTNLTNINDGNNALRLKALPNLFSTATYVIGSQAKVLCNYNALLSVRHFTLTNVGGLARWDTVDAYYNSFTTFNNNITYQE
jgi:hypothetical protein